MLKIFIAVLLPVGLFADAHPGWGQVLNQPITAVAAERLPGSYSQRIETSPVDAAMLRTPPRRTYFLDGGDVLGIFVEGVLGDLDETPPVQLPDTNSDLPPSLGYPVAVRADGTIALPLIEPISVRGLTIIQAEALVKARYLDGKRPILRAENRILVSLMRKRTVSVYVLRGDESQSSGINRSRTGAVNQRSDRSRRSNRLQLPAGDSDLLNALSRTGGLPGVNAQSDVKIYRDLPYRHHAGRYRANTNSTSHTNPGGQTSPFPRTNIEGTSYAQTGRGGSGVGYQANGQNVTIVPTRRSAGTRTYIPPTDVRLEDGDVVVVESRDTDVYYTGGLLGGGEFPLPRDRGIDVLEAIAATGRSFGAVQRAGFGVLPQRAPTELLIFRRRPGQDQLTIRVDIDRALTDRSQRIQVRSGDLLILRHTRRAQIQNAGIGVLNTVGARQVLGR